MRAAATLGVALAATLFALPKAWAQTPYPDLTIQDVTWTDGVHHYAVSQPILSPSTSDLPVEIGGTADAEYVSGTQVRLRPGFHAGGLSGSGRFHAYIDNNLGSAGDVVIISPDVNGNDPYGGMVDNVIHVHKWEKVEVGLRLPQEYQDAIDRFFEAYYPLASSGDNTASPTAPDATHDLNPYADDSLQVVMTLTRPNGSQTLKWGYYMKEGMWDNTTDDAHLSPADPATNTLVPYHVRFRFAPDMEGAWQFSVSIKAPNTSTITNVTLVDLSFSGYSLICDPPMPENNGYLQVSEANRRNLQFAGDVIAGDETPFFGLGTNMSDTHHGFYYDDWWGFHLGDFNVMQKTMDELHSVGGNFMRMWLMRNIFAPEWVNLGVYDLYKTPPVCTSGVPNNCNDTGWTTGYSSSCQYQCWAFDQMLDHAREKGIYVQLCIDPVMPAVAFEKYLWGAHPYVIHFLEPSARPYDLKEFFYANGDPSTANDDRTVFYYWKRKYKYIMSRWGYSVNIAAIEPFNEIDQMLTYCKEDEINPDNFTPPPGIPCDDLRDLPAWDFCMENRVDWGRDALLPPTIDSWITDLTEYVRGEVDPFHPETSPLGESNKLFLMSYAGGSPTDNVFHLPFHNPNVDLIDAHRAPDENEWSLRGFVENAEQYRDNTYFQNDGLKKPFHHGEFTSYGNVSSPIYKGATYQYFDNYNLSFHNELWATTFSGSFAAGTSWSWERIFWWEYGMDYHYSHLPDDVGNPAGPDHLSGLNAENSLFLGYDINNNSDPMYAEVRNRPVFHQFKPLLDFMNKPSVQDLGLFEGDFTPQPPVEADGIECIYLLNGDQDIAVGWVHNRNAYWLQGYYMRFPELQHYVDCTDPSTPQTMTLPGFDTETNFKISYFPTWSDQVDVPDDNVVGYDSGPNGEVELDLESEPFNGTFPISSSTSVTYRNHVDTLHSDYAFIIARDLVKSLRTPLIDTITVNEGWDFAIYPNPTRNELFVRLQDDLPKDITIFDLSGRQVGYWGSVTGTLQHLSVKELAMGAYWIQVSDGVHSKIRKLLVH
ncbi:MAG: T9SS type A sorting domain-containing protein [Flavobacteriales bacterium]|nr:T9SS type A sorting domain-containing protein [Flavobacteriales bacterium]